MKRQLFVNFLGAVGYIFTLLGWLWAVMLVLVNTGLLEELAAPQQPVDHPVFTVPEFTLPDPVNVVLVTIVVVVMIGLTAYALIKAPLEAIKRSSKMTSHAADTVIQAMETRAPMPKKKRRILSSRIVMWIKLALTLLPVVVVASFTLIAPDDPTLPPGIAILVSAGASLVAISFFISQYVLARILKVSLDKLL